MQIWNDYDFFLFLDFFLIGFELYVLRFTIFKREIYVVY